MKVLLLVFIAYALLYANQPTAIVISENGLKMRSTPSAGGTEIATIPFLDEVTLWETNEAKRTLTCTDSEGWEISYSPKIGRKYGQWQKVKWLGRKGWVFNAWLLYREKPYKGNLHFLNNIPQEYLLINKESPDTIHHDCRDGLLEKVTLHLHSYNSYYNKPVIIYHWERDMMEVYEILNVGFSEDGHSISVRKFNKNDVHTIRIKKTEKYFSFDPGDIQKLQAVKLLAPIDTYSGIIDVECQGDFKGYD